MIPDEVKLKTDEFPLSLHHFSPTLDHISNFSANIIKSYDGKLCNVPKLIASHIPQERYLIALPLLKHHIALGLIVTKTWRIFRFKQEACFKSYINKNITLRTNATSKSEKSFYKLLNNAIYGKCLYQARKHSSRVRLITSPKLFEKYITNLMLKECIPISSDKLLMNFHCEKIKLNYPLYIGWYVLEMSKLQMYNFFYGTLKKHYDNDVSLIYTDTDSLLLSFKNMDFFSEIVKHPLISFVDRSNFDREHYLYNNENESKLGYLKNEVGSSAIKEVICLQPKCYSVLIDEGECNRIKSTAKGVPFSKQHLLTHKKYNEIHSQVKSIEKIKCTNIIKRKNKLLVKTHVKSALTKFDNKRYWLNAVESIAFGHPSLKHVNYSPLKTKITQNQQRLKEGMGGIEVIDITDSDSDIEIVEDFTQNNSNITKITSNHAPVSLTHRRVLPGLIMYNINNYDK
jgi:hypothetical protein